MRARLAEGRGGALARVTLVTALLASGDVEGALAEAREAVSLNPDVPAVLVALGEALLAAENLPAAIAEFQRALRHDPDNIQARFLTGRAWAEAGEADKALDIFAGLDPATPGLAQWQARAEAMKNAARSDPGYVRHLFDQFSAEYDDRMRGPLSYAAPEILKNLADMVMHGRAGLSILDLGCGTGLAGVAFQPLASRLDGIDLSPAMIEKARGRGLYDQLQVGDIETFLAAAGPSYDLILAADTLVYLGDLAPVFRGARARLAPDGYFLFTVEAAVENVSGEYYLGPKRRWRHSQSYLRAAAAAAGFTVAGLVAAAPRHEANMPVEGLAVALAAGWKTESGQRFAALVRCSHGTPQSRYFVVALDSGIDTRPDPECQPSAGRNRRRHRGAFGSQRHGGAWLSTIGGLRLASELDWRFASFVFFAAAITGPLCRLLPFSLCKHLGRPAPPVDLGFLRQLWRFPGRDAAAQHAGRRQSHERFLTAGMTGLCDVSAALIVAVMAYAASRDAAALIGEPARRALLSVAGRLFLAHLCPDGPRPSLRSAPPRCLLRTQPEPDDRRASAAFRGRICRKASGASQARLPTLCIRVYHPAI